MKQKEKRKHLESIDSPQAAKKSRDVQKSDPQPENSLEEKTLVNAAKDLSCELEGYTHRSSLCMPSHVEFQTFQEDVPEPCEVVEIQAFSQASGESVSVPHYVSSPNEHTIADKDAMHQSQQEDLCVRSFEMPLPQDVEQETSTTCHDICFHVHLANEPCTLAAHKRKERPMKIYYMHVQRKREADIVWDTQEGLVPPKKRERIQELTFIGKIPSEANYSSVSTRESLTNSECSFDTEAQEEDLEADSPAEPPELEERPRVKTPEWLASPESGFKCMACCRVFPSLDILQEHVKNGVKEGFSCRIFHLAFAWMKSKGS
ncbi:protein FAM170A [Oryctolagus cuniculus]|uniref:Family with sequence similarity 170 member A n=1 Tax=Oryctolagus cuniculus TaxID=9986 RepID=U3KP11_RABIT